jgi:heptosyltransferase-2/heptosyltransferase-3
MVEVYLDLLDKLGLESSASPELELEVNPQAKEKMEEFLAESGINNQERIIALNTGGSWPTKRWPKEKFARLADRLQEEGEVIFLGGPGDVERVESIIDQMETTPVSAAGKTSLQELAALVSLCDLVISTDSGPVHVAAAVGTETTAIFGPSDERKFRPYGDGHQVVSTDIDCRPCGEHECPLEHHNCMKELNVESLVLSLES